MNSKLVNYKMFLIFFIAVSVISISLLQDNVIDSSRAPLSNKTINE